MKKIGIVIMLGIFFSCSSNAIINKSDKMKNHKLNDENILIMKNENCTETEGIVSYMFNKRKMNIIKNKNENPKYKCILDCSIIYNNTLSKGKTISKIDLTTKIYTFKDDIILYTIRMSEENYNGIDMELFKKKYTKEFLKSSK